MSAKKRLIFLPILLLVGCGASDSLALYVAGVHQSLPSVGSDDLALEGIELGARWESDRLFADASFLIHNNELIESKWIGTVRAGVKIRLPD